MDETKRQGHGRVPVIYEYRDGKWEVEIPKRFGWGESGHHDL
jgi:hypothetical protein